MSNNITKFLNSRNEVSLSSEKIELTALPNLILTAAKEGLKDIAEAIKKLEDAERLASSALSTKTDALNRIDDAKRMYGKVLPQLKDLGLSADSIPDLKEAVKTISEYNQKESIYRSILSGLSKK